MAGAVNVRALRDLTTLRRFGLSAGEYPLAGAAQGLKLRWLPPEEFEPDQAQQYVVLKLSTATGFDPHVCLPEGLFHTLLQGIEPAQFWQLDDLLRCACLQVRNNGVLEWLNQRWQCRVRVDRVTSLSGTDLDISAIPEGGAPGTERMNHPPQPGRALAFRLRTAGGLDYPPALALPGDDQQPRALSALFEAAAEFGTKIIGARAPLRMDVILGHTQVPVAELQGLQVNDIILPEAGEYSATEAVLYLQGRTLFSAGVEQGALRVKQFLRSNVMADTETSGAEAMVEDQAAGPASISPEEIDVTLHFSLGSLTRTLAEINQVAEGDLLELPRNAADGVDILVNGKRLATGEPVRIEDRIGIRVVKVDNG